MANNNYKVIRAHELLPHQKRSVEGDYSHLSSQDLDRLAPSAIDGQKLKQGLEQGEYLLLSDSPVKPCCPGKSTSKPDGTHFSGTPSASIEETYTSEPVKPDSAKNKPLLYQYCLDINCSWQTFQRYRGGSLTLAQSSAEISRCVAVKQPLVKGHLRCHFFCTEQEPKKLQQGISGAPYPFYHVDDVIIDPKGAAQTREAFLLVTPMVQWYGQLAYATEGYYYYFRDNRLLAEYQLAGNGIPTFRATLSSADALSDTPAGQSTSAIMLYWREKGKIVKNQYLLYRQGKLTTDELAQVDQRWLMENGTEVDVEKALAAVEAGAQPNADTSLPYHHLASVQYDHTENSLPGSPGLYPNRRDNSIGHIELPVVNVASLTLTPNWIELQFVPGAKYTITEPTTADDIPTNIVITGTLDSNGFAHIDMPEQYRGCPEFNITYEQSLAPLPWYQRHLNRILGGVQAVSGAASIVFAAGLTSTGVGAPVALGIATFGFDNLQAGSQALLNNQLARTLGGRTLELTGLSSEKAELLYSILDLTATMKVIKLAVSKGGYQMLQVNVSSGKVDRIKLIRAKINRRHHIVADELKVVDAAEAANQTVTTKIVGNLEPGNVLSTSIVRNGDRLVLNQGSLPTCGPNSCAMVLDTAGLKFDLGKLISDSKVGSIGARMSDMVPALHNQGLTDARFLLKTSAKDISAATSHGNPAIVAMNLNRGYHAVVVDGITVRNGQNFVAIRDPALGRQYFTPIDEFNRKFTGQAIFTNPK